MRKSEDKVKKLAKNNKWRKCIADFGSRKEMQQHEDQERLQIKARMGNAKRRKCGKEMQIKKQSCGDTWKKEDREDGGRERQKKNAGMLRNTTMRGYERGIIEGKMIYEKGDFEGKFGGLLSTQIITTYPRQVVTYTKLFYSNHLESRHWFHGTVRKISERCDLLNTNIVFRSFATPNENFRITKFFALFPKEKRMSGHENLLQRRKERRDTTRFV